MNEKSKTVIYFLILLFSLLAVTTIIYINQGNQEERYYFQVSINHKGNKYKINYWNEGNFKKKERKVSYHFEEGTAWGIGERVLGSGWKESKGK